MDVVRTIKTFARETVAKFYDLLGSGKPVVVPDASTQPWCAVCLIQSTFDDGGAINGTGFLVSARMAITAAHNLCKLDKQGRRIAARQISVTLGSTTGSKHNPAIATRFVYDKRYADNLEQRWNSELEKTGSADGQMKAVEFEDPSYYDYGAILLDEELASKPAFVFKIGGMEQEDPRWDRPLTCAGYLADRNYALCYADGAAYPDDKGRFIGSKSNLVVHRAISEKGQSGGPLYLQDDDGGYVVVGIQVRQNKGDVAGSGKRTNGAVRITKDMRKAFAAWDEENRKANSQFGKGVHDLEVGSQGLIA